MTELQISSDLASPLKQRPGDQPLPVANDHPDIQSQVIADLEQRRLVGIQRYGTALQPHNGRDALRDTYEELLDASCYIKQAMVERAATIDNPDELVASWPTRHRVGRECPHCGQDVTAVALVSVAYTFEECACSAYDYRHLAETIWHRACLPASATTESA